MSEQIEKMCQPLGVRTVMKTVNTLKSRLVKVKQAIPNSKKKSVIYEVPRTALCVHWRDRENLGETA